MTLSNNTLLSAGLFLSLLGNLALGGMALGHHHAPEARIPESLRPILRYMKDVPPAKQKELQSIVEPAQASLKEKFETLAQQRNHIAELLQAPTIDKKQLEEEFGKYRDMTSDIERTSEAAILDAALALPQDDRERMLAAPPPKRGHRPHRP